MVTPLGVAGASTAWAIVVCVGTLAALFVLLYWAVSLSKAARRHWQERRALLPLIDGLVSEPPQVAELCQSLYRCCAAVLDIPVFVVQLWDGQTVSLPLAMIAGAEVTPERAGRGALDRMLTAPEAALTLGADSPVIPPLSIGETPKSAIYIPIPGQDTFRGVVSLQSPGPRRYTPEDLAFVSRAVDQVAIGLYAARLCDEANERSRQMAMIAEVSRRVAAILDLESLFSDTVKLVQDTFGYYHVSIFAVDPKAERVVLEASSSEAIQATGLDIVWGAGMIGATASVGQRMVANAALTDARFLKHPALPAARSELAIPLRVEDRILGVLDLQADRVNAFSDGDASVLQILADQIAVAIEDSRIYEGQQEEAWVATAVLQVADALAAASNPGQIVSSIVRLTEMLTGAQSCLVFLWSEEEDTFSCVGAAGLSWEQRDALDGVVFAEDDIPLLQRVLCEGRKEIARAEELARYLPPPLVDLGDDLEVAALPLWSGQKFAGVFVVIDAAGVDLEGGPRARILGGVASHTAIALENARLYAAQREEGWVSTALLQVANVAASANYDLEATLRTIVRLTPMLVGSAWCTLLLWDRERESLSGTIAHGLPDETMALLSNAYCCPEDTPLLQHLIETEEPLTLTDPDELRGPSPNSPLCDLGPLTALPLLAHSRFLGVLLAGHMPGCTAISGRRMSILSGIAQQAALAIEAAKLQDQIVAQERLQREVELASSIQESFLPECCPQIAGWQLGLEWRPARGVGGDFYDFIFLGPRRLGVVIADVSDKGVGAALYMALSRTVLRAVALDAAGPGEALRRTNRILMEHSGSGMFVSVFYGVLDLDHGLLEYARGGHNPPLLLRARGETVDPLDSPGVVLGVLEDADFVESSAQIGPGDALVMYTDGVTEAVGGEGVEFGEERLRQVLTASSELDPAELVRRIDAGVRDHSAGHPQFDDFSLVVLKRVAESPTWT